MAIKTVLSTTPTTYTNPKGEVIQLVHVVYTDGSTESVDRGSINDPSSPNYNEAIDEREQ